MRNIVWVTAEILWVITALLVTNLPVTYFVTKFNRYYIEKSFSEYGYDGIVIRFKNRTLGLIFIAACAVLWPIAYPACMARCYFKYRKARKNYLKNLEDRKHTDELYEKWHEEKVAG